MATLEGGSGCGPPWAELHPVKAARPLGGARVRTQRQPRLCWWLFFLLNCSVPAARGSGVGGSPRGAVSAMSQRWGGVFLLAPSPPAAWSRELEPASRQQRVGSLAGADSVLSDSPSAAGTPLPAAQTGVPVCANGGRVPSRQRANYCPDKSCLTESCSKPWRLRFWELAFHLWREGTLTHGVREPVGLRPHTGLPCVVILILRRD